MSTSPIQREISMSWLRYEEKGGGGGCDESDNDDDSKMR